MLWCALHAWSYLNKLSETNYHIILQNLYKSSVVETVVKWETRETVKHGVHLVTPVNSFRSFIYFVGRPGDR